MPTSLPLPHLKQILIKGSNTGLCYSSSKMEGKVHLQLLCYKAITFFFFCQIINYVIKQHSRKGRQRQITTFVSVLVWTVEKYCYH